MSTKHASRGKNRTQQKASRTEPAAKTSKSSNLTLVSPQKDLDTPAEGEVGSSQPPIPATTIQETTTMQLTYKSLSKNGKNAFYTGAATVLRIALSAFPDRQAPPVIEVADGAFAPAKVALTKEERKAAKANQPKPTLAERIAKREAQLAKDKAKLAAASQPSL